MICKFYGWLWEKVVDRLLGPAENMDNYIDTTGKKWSDGR